MNGMPFVEKKFSFRFLSQEWFAQSCVMPEFSVQYARVSRFSLLTCARGRAASPNTYSGKRNGAARASASPSRQLVTTSGKGKEDPSFLLTLKA